MKNLAILMIPLLLWSCSCVEAGTDSTGKDISIIPAPITLVKGSGNYTIKGGSVSYDTSFKEFEDIVAYINEKITPATGLVYDVARSPKTELTFNIVNDESLGKEGYTLSVAKNGIVISSNTPAGAFYGVQSLLQLLPAQIKSGKKVDDVSWTIPYVEIKDTPRFGWRGLMLDVSRHFFTKEEVKKYIDELAEYKMNIFHWHLTDDQGWRIEIKSMPELTNKGSMRAERVGNWWGREPQREGEEATYGGYYSQEDIKEVIEYAKKRFVTIVPEIDVPGHSVAFLVAYPELACMKAPKSVNVGNKFYGIDENSLCVGNEKSFEYMENVLKEVAALFPSEYIHIGGDECFKGFWAKCPKCKARMTKENLKDVNQLQSYFIRRMEKITKDQGKKLIGWDEIHEGGLAPEAVVMSWRGMQGGIDAAKQGHHVIMTPNDHCYIDLYQGEPSVEPDTYSMCRLKDSYAFEPVPEGIDPSFILGGQGNLWAESVPTFRHAEYMTWPRGWAIAEVLWSDKKDWNSFVKRTEEHFNRADNADILYAKSMYNAIIAPFTNESDEVLIELKSELDDVDIYYTFDNTNVDTHSKKYESPLSVPKDATRIVVNTYRGDKQVGKQISILTSDLLSRAKNNKRVVGNL